MAISSKKSSFRKILLLVFGVAFGLVALALVYQAAISSTDIRSRAAQTNEIYKKWEFNGATTEGWMQSNLVGFKVANGLLIASTTNNNAILSNKSVAAAMPVGNKYLKFRLAVLNFPQPTPKPIIALGDIVTPTISPQPRTFTITVSYFIRGTSQQRVFPAIPGTAFGNLYEYSVRFPDIGGITIDSIQMTVNPVRVGMSIQLDWVRLMGPPPPTPTPTPPPGCYYKQVECLKAPCAPILVCPTPTPTPSGCNKDCNYTVHPARTCQTGLICVSQSQLLGASGLCRNPNCSNETSCQCSTPKPTPTPQSGCYYKQVQCIKAPCPPILVCPTPTPTPIGKNICTGAKDGTPCVDTCASACPPTAQVCTMQCVTRKGFCMNQRCETWLTPTPQPQYTCPPNGYVNCMPILTPEAEAACSADAIAWYKQYCPNFRGVTY